MEHASEAGYFNWSNPPQTNAQPHGFRRVEPSTFHVESSDASMVVRARDAVGNIFFILGFIFSCRH